MFSKDVWMLGIGLSLMADTIVDRAQRRSGNRARRRSAI
jgi:hypothetical protein